MRERRKHSPTLLDNTARPAFVEVNNSVCCPDFVHSPRVIIGSVSSWWIVYQPHQSISDVCSWWLKTTTLG